MNQTAAGHKCVIWSAELKGNIDLDQNDLQWFTFLTAAPG